VPPHTPVKASSPTAWSGQVCQALTTYKDDVGKLDKSFEAKVRRSKTLGDIKSRFTTFLRDVATRTDKMLGQLRKAGIPDAPEGAQVAVAIQNGMLQLRDAFERLVNESRQLPTGSPADFQTAFRTLQGHITDSESQNQAVFRQASGFSSPSLERAFRSQAACKRLRS
jgi:hypothetical protein